MDQSLMVPSSPRIVSGTPAVTGVTQAELIALQEPGRAQQFMEKADGEVPVTETHTISI